ncbi:MAG: hypothetical protein ABIJ56_00775 [Pseudomonadota bacterium]
MKLFSKRNLAIAALVSCICLVCGFELAEAAKKDSCKIYIAKKAVPLKVFQKHSGTALMGWFKGNKTLEVWERDEEEGGGWDFWILLVFQKPLKALMVDISFYDVEVFPKHLINTFELMLMKKGEKIIPHRIKLKKGEFKANRRYMMQISVNKVIKGSQEFNLRGRGVKYSGEVVFSDEDAGVKKKEKKKE